MEEENINNKAAVLSDLKEVIEVPSGMTDLEKKAMIFAHRKHEEIDHTRKYSGKPYIVHPSAVVELVRSVEHTPQMLAAAWLHDTVEDTKTSLEQIREVFGEEVYELVEMLTDISEPEDGNRKTRKEIDRQHTAKANPQAKTVKLADLIHNSKSIIEQDPGFARVYLREMRDLLEVLKEGNSSLWERAYEIAHQ